MKKNNKKSGKSNMSGKGMAMAAAGAAAVGAGAYYLMGPNGKAHQKKAKALMTKIKKEVASEAKKAKVVATPLYHKAVDMISENYAKQYAMHAPEIRAFAKNLKSEWQKAGKEAKKEVKKTVKKAVKKPTKTSAKKRA